MKVSVLGSGVVGRAHAGKLGALGHAVTLGTQDPAKTLAAGGSFADWHARHPEVVVAPLREAAASAELVLLALNGGAVVAAVSTLRDELAGKVVIDITNGFVFRDGEMELTVCNTDSLGERIQRAIPAARVVKAFSTVNCDVQVAPETLAGGAHDMFIAGDDLAAKQLVTDLLRSYGWKHVTDAGGVRACRGIEMMLPMWLTLMRTLGTARFNYRLVRDGGADS